MHCGTHRYFCRTQRPFYEDVNVSTAYRRSADTDVGCWALEQDTKLMSSPRLTTLADPCLSFILSLFLHREVGGTLSNGKQDFPLLFCHYFMERLIIFLQYHKI